MMDLDLRFGEKLDRFSFNWKYCSNIDMVVVDNYHIDSMSIHSHTSHFICQ